MLVEIHLLRSPRRGAQAAGRSQEAWAWLLATLGTLKSVSCLRVKWAMNPTLSLTVSRHPKVLSSPTSGAGLLHSELGASLICVAIWFHL